MLLWSILDLAWIPFLAQVDVLGANQSWPNNSFEQHASTGNGLFALFGHDCDQNIRQIVFMRVMTLSNTNLVASRDIEMEMD